MRYSLVPAEMTALERWVCAWRDSKCPMKAFERTAAGVSNADDWADFACATTSVANGAYDDIGFIFAGDGIIGVDVDDGFDEDGFPTDETCEILKRFDSYAELSRSGRGFHIYAKGVLPLDGYNNRAGKEIYQSGRYFIVTGKRVWGTELASNQDAVNWYLDRYFKDQPAGQERRFSPRQYNSVWPRPSARVPLRPSYPPIGEGGRNVSLLSLGGALREAGYTTEQLYRELLFANGAACEPPLSAGEVRAIAESCMRYKR